jgi:hypothetical protein
MMRGWLVGCGRVASLLLLSLAWAVPGEASSLRDQAGQRAAIVGRVSTTPWQHMISAIPHKTETYIDLEDGSQTVAYFGGRIACAERVLLEARVVLIEGRSKRPGAKETASEVQLDVERWTCLDAAGARQLLSRLTDPKVARSAKVAAESGLVGAGLVAVPLLLGSLADPRECWRDRVLVNRAELENRAPTAPTVEARFAEEKITLAMRCDAMLTRLVTPPRYDSPSRAGRKPFSLDAAPFRVESWRAFFARRKGKTLSQIHEEMKPVLDAYWKSGGVPQKVR